MNAQLSKKSKFFCLMMTFVMILEFFAMVNIGLIVKYAKKKAWKELAKVVIRFAKGVLERMQPLLQLSWLYGLSNVE